MTVFPNYYRCLGETIRAARKRVAISQMVLAERAGVTRRFLQELENGRSDVSLLTLLRLSAALDMTLSDVCAQIEQAMTTKSDRVV
jgi:transcriptional regulator with XRE-family HTH domain